MPVRSTPARLRSASTTRAVGWAGYQTCGDMCGAAWEWSHSFLCDAEVESGAVVAAGVPVAQIIPGEGVVLEGGERIAARIVVSNADPQQTLRLLGNRANAAWCAQVEGIPIEGCTVKLNVLLRELPNFLARPGTDAPHHYGQINAPLTKAEWKSGFAQARRGELPEHLWCELYFQERA